MKQAQNSILSKHMLVQAQKRAHGFLRFFVVL